VNIGDYFFTGVFNELVLLGRKSGGNHLPCC